MEYFKVMIGWEIARRYPRAIPIGGPTHVIGRNAGELSNCSYLVSGFDLSKEDSDHENLYEIFADEGHTDRSPGKNFFGRNPFRYNGNWVIFTQCGFQMDELTPVLFTENMPLELPEVGGRKRYAIPALELRWVGNRMSILSPSGYRAGRIIVEHKSK